MQQERSSAGCLVDEDASSSERDYASLTHLTALLSLFDFSGVVPLIVAAIMWRIRSGESPFLDDHGREAVNFQLSLLLYALVGSALGVFVSVVTLGIGLLVVAPLGVAGAIALLVLRLVGSIRGAIAANRGEFYRYPMCLRLLRGPQDAA